MKKALVIYPLCFLALIVLFFFSMWAVYSIPHEDVKANVNAADALLAQEGNYPVLFFNTQAARLDNFTDRLMINTNRDKIRDEILTTIFDMV